MLDADGMVIMEEKEIKIPMFKPVTAFDVSQTQGKPLPQLASDLHGNVQNHAIFMEALRRASPVPIDFKPIRDGSDGFFSLDNQSITIREGMSEVQTVSAVVHEIAHSKLHNHADIEQQKDRNTEGVEAESISFAVCAYNQRIRMDSLGEGYREAELRAVIAGQQSHRPKKRRTLTHEKRPQTVIDIQAKLAAGMGEGYRRWATVENLKRMARTKLYMDEHGFSYEDMAVRKSALAAKEKELSERIAQAQKRIAEINVVKTHIVNYSKIRDIYVA